MVKFTAVNDFLAYKKILSRNIPIEVNNKLFNAKNQNRNFFWIYDEINDIPVGLISYSKKNAILNLEYLVVLHEYRRQKYGTSAVRFLECQEFDSYRIEVHTSVDNIVAIRFYQQNGFHITEIEENYYNSLSNSKAVKLEKILNKKVN